MKKVLDPIIKVIGFIMGLMVLATIIVIVMQIIWRRVLGDPLAWTEQAGRYLFVWIVMLALPVGCYKSGMYSFDLLREKLPTQIGNVVSIINYLACEVFCSYYFWQATQLCLKGGWRYAQGIHIRMIWMYIAQPICAGLLFLIFLDQMISAIKKMRLDSVKGEEN